MSCRIYAALTFVFGLAACGKSFLAKTPESNPTTGNYYTSAVAAENGLTGAYHDLINGNFYMYDNFMNTDGRSDNCFVNGDNVTAEHPLENFTLTAANTNVQRDWQEMYQDITAANIILDNVPGIDDPVWNGTNRKVQILGEARFLRALAYYWLVTEWGACPLILTTTNGGNYYPPRDSVSTVYAQIETDLKFADSVLPVAPYNGEYGRATKGAADALLAKTYAQSGDYTDCLSFCNKVINGGAYSLVPNFANLWGLANKNNAESIFEVQFTGTGTPYANWGVELFAYVSSDGWPKRDIGAWDLVRTFKAAGDTLVRYKTTFNWQIANASFNMPSGAWNADSVIPFMHKYPDPSGFNSPDNIVVLRLADIILLAAEANNQLNNTAAAIGELNQIRSRAGLPPTTAGTQATLGPAILLERRLELVDECSRWNDLLRADANGYLNVVDLMNSQTDVYGNNLNYNVAADKHQYLFPVPLQDLQLNKNLTQNPGY
ncbi:RagB/SusD family nutrient uptake outer membrane protein [Dinghuibacter silviterrae]|uniref:Putative outer membrane starch-binding protein n=1 Tax=Dinghuibacter silviterrae TaxID=1539049 RepID=A0A4R8DHI7_9BACT|nr:RagB/SusD family nutrient uptake outer membrane protein [Dinghuibacter silviterrae]TDW96576.1 putative outer membrane starch-binding protein [Dinghuibacter silviterrae]